MAGSPKTRFYNFLSQDFLMFVGTPSWTRTGPTPGTLGLETKADYDLSARALALRQGSATFRRCCFLRIDCVRAHRASPDRVAVVTLIALVGRNIESNLCRWARRRMPMGGQLAGRFPFLCSRQNWCALPKGAGVEQENHQRMASSLRPPGSSSIRICYEPCNV
jgi:hypothetical protein